MSYPQKGVRQKISSTDVLSQPKKRSSTTTVRVRPTTAASPTKGSLMAHYHTADAVPATALTAVATIDTDTIDAQLEHLSTTVPAVTSSRGSKLRLACQRGMATAEYAVGILAAVALALVLLKVFNDNAFFDVLLRFVVDLIKKIQLP